MHTSNARVMIALASLLSVAAMASSGGSPDWFVTGGSANARFGETLASAGDINGDGFEDLIVGSPRYANGSVEEGRVSIFLGSAAGLQTPAYQTIESNYNSAHYGAAVAGIGDVNGDGYDDVAVGAPDATNGHQNEGRLYIYKGSQTGLDLAAVTVIESNIAYAHFGASVSKAGDVNGDHHADFVVGSSGTKRVSWFCGASGVIPTSESGHIDGPVGSASFGVVVSAGADFDGDGHPDLAVGDPETGILQNGAAAVYLGTASGFSSTVHRYYAGGPEFTTRFGYALSASPDLNGDGYGDLAVGAPGQLGDTGVVYVYYGSATGLPATASWTTAGTDLAASELGTALDATCDVNGDGVSDLVIGAEWASDSPVAAPAVQVRLGSATGLSNAPDWMSQPAGAGSRLGSSVCAGDFNGNAFGDVVAGLPGLNGAGANEGAVDGYFDVIAPPPAPASPGQFKVDGLTPIAPGGTTGQASFVVSAAVSDSLHRAVSLQVQVAPTGAAFPVDAPITQGASVVDAVATVTIPIPADATLMWRVRSITTGSAVSTWIHFGLPDDTEVDVRTPVNRPPRKPETVLVHSGAPGDPIFDSDSVGFKATVLDPNGSDVRLAVEIQPLGSSFTGQASLLGPLLPAGAESTLAIPTPVRGSYHVQSWTIDDRGLSSTVAALNGNAENDADFVVEAAGSLSSHAGCSALGGSSGILLLALIATLRPRR